LAPLPQVFTNAVKATALANAQAVLGGTWFQRENWDGVDLAVGAVGTGSGQGYVAGLACPGERWVLAYGAGRIDLQLLSNGNWQATLFPGS
jgi:hypothetical protein